MFLTVGFGEVTKVTRENSFGKDLKWLKTNGTRLLIRASHMI